MKKMGGILLCIILACAAWWWTHRAAYSPGEEFLAIPSDVDIISSHDRPAERFPALVQNPLIRLAFQAAEVDMEELDVFCQDGTQMAAISAVLSKRLVLAHLPDDRSEEGTWLAVSWVGNQGVQFNLLAGLLAGDALEQAKHSSGSTLWRLRDTEGEVQTYFSIQGELLLMSVGIDDLGMLLMIETLANEKPSFDPAHLFGESVVSGSSPDRGMVRTTQDGEPLVVHFDIEQADAEALSLLFEFPDLNSPNDIAPQSVQLLESYEGLVGDRARLGVMMPASWASSFGEIYLDETWGLFTKDLLAFLGPRPVFLSAFDGDMGGQIKIIRIPALALAIPVTNQEEAETLMREALLTMNKHLPFHLFNERVEGRNDTWAIASAARNPYRGLRGDERMGYRIIGRWLIVSSSLRTLAKFPAGPKTLVSNIVEPGWGSTYGWVDLKGSMKSVRNGLSMYMLALAFDSSSDAATRRATLLMYRDWAELAGQCGHLQFSTQKVGNTLRLRVKQSSR